MYHLHLNYEVVTVVGEGDIKVHDDLGLALRHDDVSHMSQANEFRSIPTRESGLGGRADRNSYLATIEGVTCGISDIELHRADEGALHGREFSLGEDGLGDVVLRVIVVTIDGSISTGYGTIKHGQRFGLCRHKHSQRHQRCEHEFRNFLHKIIKVNRL